MTHVSARCVICRHMWGHAYGCPMARRAREVDDK